MTVHENELLEGLEQLGCRVEKAEDGIFVSLGEDYGEFVFEQMGARIFLGSMLLAPEEIAASEHAAALNRFLLELQDRSLGCHFSYNQEGFLTIGHEFYSEQVASRDLLGVMEQIGFVIDVCLPVLDRILDTGEIPDDRQMDQAFGLQMKLH